MNDPQHTALSAYLRELADALALKDWDILLMRDRAAHDTRAQVLIPPEKDEAAVFLSEDWAAYSPEQQRQTLTHELLHAHTARLRRVLTRLEAESDLLTYVRAVASEEEEILVDRLARVLAPHLPLPPVP